GHGERERARRHGRGRQLLRGVDRRYRRGHPYALWHAALRKRLARGPRAHVLRDGRRDGPRPPPTHRGGPPDKGTARARDHLQQRAPGRHEGGRARARTRRSTRAVTPGSRDPGAWAVVGVSVAALAAGTFAIVAIGALAPDLK